MRADILVLTAYGTYPHPAPAVIQPPNRQVNAGRQEGVPCLPAIVYCLTAGKWPADIANHNNVAELYIRAMVTVIETRGYFCL